jgi:hypothetical protein
MTETKHAPRSYWFVGASYGRTEDQTPRFVNDGIWENGYDNRYLYQMYAYLRSQEGSGDGYSADAEGLLLHPAVGSSFDESVVTQDHKIRFMTMDLTANASDIRAELLRASQPETDVA